MSWLSVDAWYFFQFLSNSFGSDIISPFLHQICSMMSLMSDDALYSFKFLSNNFALDKIGPFFYTQIFAFIWQQWTQQFGVIIFNIGLESNGWICQFSIFFFVWILNIWLVWTILLFLTIWGFDKLLPVCFLFQTDHKWSMTISCRYGHGKSYRRAYKFVLLLSAK